MINNLILFQRKILDKNGSMFKFYLSLYHKHLLHKYAIFTDTCGIRVDDHMPIFHTFYLRHNFNKKIILTDTEGFGILKDFAHDYGAAIVFDNSIQEDEFIHYLEEISNDQLF
jgi:hypothetical protein